MVIDKIAMKLELLNVLRKYGAIEDKDTGQLIIHLNDGTISKIFKNVNLFN
jgi:hypothetical protein